jgi:hypothetical protein
VKLLKTFEQFGEISFRLKTLVNCPDLQDVFDICKNEITLYPESEPVYTRIYECCLYEQQGLTLGHLEFIKPIREMLTKSSTALEAKNKYREITNPKHIIPALLLKMLNNIRTMKFVNEKVFGSVSDKVSYVLRYEFTGTKKLSKSYWTLLLRAMIILE